MASHLNKQRDLGELKSQPGGCSEGKQFGVQPTIQLDVERDGSVLPFRTSAARWNLLWVLAIFLLVIMGCKDRNAIERATQRGAAAGAADGRAAGDAGGYTATYKPAKDAAYKEKVQELYAANEYSRKLTYTAWVLASGFGLGFTFQYLILYLLRRNEVFPDIDRIVLPKHKIPVSVTDLFAQEHGAGARAVKPADFSNYNSRRG